jgi:hypothetical protein
MRVDGEEAVPHRLPALGSELTLPVRVNPKHLVRAEPLTEKELLDEGRDGGVLHHDEHLRVLVRVLRGELSFEDLQSFETGSDHRALSVGEFDGAVVIALHPELQLVVGNRADFLALVERERLDQPRVHCRVEGEVHDDVVEPQLLAARLVVGSGGEVELDEAAALTRRDLVEAPLPLDLGLLLALLHGVHVVRFVVEDHEARKILEPLHRQTTSLSPIEHLQAVAGGGARREGDEAHRCRSCVDMEIRGVDVVFLDVEELRVLGAGEKVPVGYRDHSRASHRAADLRLLNRGRLNEGEHRGPAVVWDEQVGIRCHVACREVASGRRPAATERVEEPVVDDQSWSDHQEVAAEARVVRGGDGIEVLPYEKRVEHPRLARARCHLRRILGVRVPVGRQLSQTPGVQYRRPIDLLVEVEHARGTECLVCVHDGEDRIALPDVEVGVTHGGVVRLKPVPQKFRGDRGDRVEECARLARLDGRDVVRDAHSYALGEGEDVGDHARAGISSTTSDSKPKTSTALTQTVRGESRWGAMTDAVVTVRSGSASFSMLSR